MSEAATIQAILATCHDRGIALSVAGEKLAVDAPKGALTPGLLDALRQQKPSLLDILQREEGGPEATHCDVESRPEALSAIPANADVTPWEECIEPPDPCPGCGSLMFWWDVLGREHCMMCEKPAYPPGKAAELRELAKRLRQGGKRRSLLRECR